MLSFHDPPLHENEWIPRRAGPCPPPAGCSTDGVPHVHNGKVSQSFEIIYHLRAPCTRTYNILV